MKSSAFTLVLAGLVCFSFSGLKKKATPPQGCWMNSHEEDQNRKAENFNVYRPCSYPFPAARGRSGFILKPGGEIGLIGPNAGDGRDTIWGNWVLIDKRELKLAFASTKLSRLKWKQVNRRMLLIDIH